MGLNGRIPSGVQGSGLSSQFKGKDQARQRREQYEQTAESHNQDNARRDRVKTHGWMLHSSLTARRSLDFPTLKEAQTGRVRPALAV
jgi:hypothetical protein